MKRRFALLIILVAVSAVLAAPLGGCASKVQETAKQQDAATGPGVGKTLLIATQNLTSHPESPGSRSETQTQVGTVVQDRGTAYVYDVAATDPRVTGKADAVDNADVRSDNSGEIWGTWILTNSDGTWTGEYSGAVSASSAAVPAGGYFRIDAKGTGAYNGLELHLLGRDALNEGFEPGTDHVLAGWIQEAE